MLDNIWTWQEKKTLIGFLQEVSATENEKEISTFVVPWFCVVINFLKLLSVNISSQL